jgi:hypothetical protein
MPRRRRSPQDPRLRGWRWPAACVSTRRWWAGGGKSVSRRAGPALACFRAVVAGLRRFRGWRHAARPRWSGARDVRCRWVRSLRVVRLADDASPRRRGRRLARGLVGIAANGCRHSCLSDEVNYQKQKSGSIDLHFRSIVGPRRRAAQNRRSHGL